MKKTFKAILCLALAVLMLAPATLAATTIAGDDVAMVGGGVSASTTDGKLKVTVPSSMLTPSQEDYLILVLKVNSNVTVADDATAAQLLAAVQALPSGTMPYDDIDADKILYIDQQAVSGDNVVFAGNDAGTTGFLPMSIQDSVIVLTGNPGGPVVLGVIKGHGFTMTATVDVKSGTAADKTAATVKLDTATPTATSAGTGANEGKQVATFPGVVAGSHTFTAASGTKYVPREYPVTVSANATVAMEIWAKGDVTGNGDGIRINDVSAIFNHYKEVPGKALSGYALACADVAGTNDGVRINDVSAIFNHYKEVPGKNLW